jgi:hypothetical protein
VQRSEIVNYTTGIYKKVKLNATRKINLHGMLPAIVFYQMESMRTHLENANFDELIQKSVHLLPADVRHQFNNFTQQLLKLIDTNVCIFAENWEFFSLSAKTPKPMEELFKVIEKQMRVEPNEVNKKKLQQFGRRIRWKWCKAAFNYAYYAHLEKNGKNNL